MTKLPFEVLENVNHKGLNDATKRLKGNVAGVGSRIAFIALLTLFVQQHTRAQNPNVVNPLRQELGLDKDHGNGEFTSGGPDPEDEGGELSGEDPFEILQGLLDKLNTDHAARKLAKGDKDEINPDADFHCEGNLSTAQEHRDRMKFYASVAGITYRERLKKRFSKEGGKVYDRNNGKYTETNFGAHEKSTIHTSSYTIAFTQTHRNSLSESSRSAIINNIINSSNSSEIDQESKGVDEVYSLQGACQLLILPDPDPYTSAATALVLEGMNIGVNRAIMFVGPWGGNAFTLNRYPGESLMNNEAGIAYVGDGTNVLKIKHEAEHMHGNAFPDWITNVYDPDNDEVDPHNSIGPTSLMGAAPGVGATFIDNGNEETSDVIAANRVLAGTIGSLDCVTQIGGAPLAIELIHFAADHDCKEITLSFEAYEHNNIGYFVIVNGERMKNVDGTDIIIPSQAQGQELNKYIFAIDIDKLRLEVIKKGVLVQIEDIPSDGAGKASDIVYVDLSHCDDLYISSYPNPTKGQVTIQGGNINEISVYNTLGQLMDIYRDINPDNTKQEIDISDLPNGIYSIVVRTQNDHPHRIAIVKTN